jgi:hypothetical protein
VSCRTAIPPTAIFAPVGADNLLRWVVPNDDEITRGDWLRLLMARDPKARTPESGFLKLDKVVAFVEDDANDGDGWFLTEGGFKFLVEAELRDDLRRAMDGTMDPTFDWRSQ